jgi:hypothetical protein
MNSTQRNFSLFIKFDQQFVIFMKKYICVLKRSALHYVKTKLKSELLKNFQWKFYTANSYKNVSNNSCADTMSQTGTGIP